MEGHKKNPDKLNTIGIITVGGVGSALVYLSIVGLQAFYVDETAIVDEVRSFGDQEKVRTSLKAEQIGHIESDLTRKGVNAEGKPVIAIPIETAKGLIVRDAKVDAAFLVPMVGRSETSTIQPIFGRPVALPPPPPAPVPPPADGAVPGVVPPDGATPGTPPPGPPTPGTPAPAQPNPGVGTPNAPAGTPQPGQIPAPTTPSTQPRPGTPAPAVQPPAARPTTVPATGSAAPAQPPAHGGGH